MAAATAQTCRWRTVAAGAAITAVGWLLMGLSLAALLAAMSEPVSLLGHMHFLRALALLTAMVALSTVGGFVSFIPGGLGAREWLLLELLKPWTGPAQAILAAILLRLVWIVAEVGAAGLFWLLDSPWKRRQIRQS
jgi:hypothetical protein